MEAAPRPDDDTPVESDPPKPADEPTGDILPERRRRIPVPTFFVRRAFHSKDTGRWHKRPGGGNDHHDRPKT
jgi:hypothetical protein